MTKGQSEKSEVTKTNTTIAIPTILSECTSDTIQIRSEKSAHRAQNHRISAYTFFKSIIISADILKSGITWTAPSQQKKWIETKNGIQAPYSRNCSLASIVIRPFGASSSHSSNHCLCVSLSYSSSYIVLDLRVGACSHQDLHSCGATVVRGKHERWAANLYIHRYRKSTKENKRKEVSEKGTKWEVGHNQHLCWQTTCRQAQHANRYNKTQCTVI